MAEVGGRWETRILGEVVRRTVEDGVDIEERWKRTPRGESAG